MKYLFKFILPLLRFGVEALSSTETELTDVEFDGDWGKECRNTKIPLPAVCRIRREADLIYNITLYTCILRSLNIRNCIYIYSI